MYDKVCRWRSAVTLSDLFGKTIHKGFVLGLTFVSHISSISKFLFALLCPLYINENLIFASSMINFSVLLLAVGAKQSI